MSWAAGRRLVVFLIIGALGAAVLAVLSISVFYKAPSCADNVMNQGEAGIDCGGPCAYRCTEQEQVPTVLFTKVIENGEGRSDIVAQVENKNLAAAAKNVPYIITLYGTNQAPIGRVKGQLDLPPNSTVPIFVPGASAQNQVVTAAFLEINPTLVKWFSMPTDTRIVPLVSAPNLGGMASAPRVEAVLTNGSVTELINVRAIALVHNSAGDVIAASATLVPIISRQGQATALFTWNAPFTGVPTRIEVIPVIPLP